MSQNEKKPADQFQALLGDLGTMAKAMDDAAVEPDGDEKIAAADAEGAPADGDPKVDADGKPMTKSMQVTLPDGSVVEAEDGTALVKSLIERLDGTETVMAKALGAAVDLIKKQGEALASTNTLVKSLQTKVAELSAQPAGRKTVLTVHDKPAGTMVKSEPEGMSEPEFMAKAMTAFKAGKITGLEISTAETSINRGQPVPNDIITRVLS